MKNLTLTLMLFIGLSSFGQRTGDVTFFSNSGDQLFVILNGIQQNAKAQTNVKVQGLTNPWYDCKIVSSDNLFTITKNIMVKTDTLITYRVVEKRGVYKLRFFSETPLTTAPSVPAETIVHYHSTPLPNEQLMHTEVGATSITTTTTITETSTSGDSGVTTGTTTGSGDESIGVNVSVSDDGMSVDMSVTGTGFEDDMQMDGTTTYSETTTTTTTTSTSSGNNVTTNTGTSGSQPVSMSNCLVDGSDMEIILKMVETESFADDQMRVAKQYAKKKCLTASQVKEIAVLFSFADDQLSFIKYAYTNCINKDDYYQLMDVFTFSSDKEALEKFLDQQ